MFLGWLKEGRVSMTRLTAKIFFVVLFGVLVLVGSQINFSSVLGADNQFFTLFQFFGPIAGAFLGSFIGVASVLLAELANFFVIGKNPNLLNLARLLPMLFAAYYFGVSKQKDWSLLVPIMAMVAFVLHPIGQQAWFYSLYWSIPLLARLAPKRLFFKSLGATFTAHAVGSTIWLYTIPSTPEFWIALIPIVAIERVLFALGISGSYLAINTLLSKVEHFLPHRILNLNPSYDLSKMLRLKAGR